ncbi:MAG: hypothetical protein ABSC06_11530 [Rhodopila sp.]|jgi:hypothetical protein
MSRCSSAVFFAGLSFLLCGVSAPGETLRCQSINGNLNCAGSSGASCQTVDGKSVCVSGHGDVLQSFGNGPSPEIGTTGADRQGRDSEVPDRAVRERLEQHDFRGHTMLWEHDGTQLHLRTDWLPIDRD